MHISPAHFGKRQATALPSASGLGAAATAAAGGGAVGNSLLLGSTPGAPAASPTAGLVAGQGDVTVTQAPTSTPIVTPTGAATSPSASSSSAASSGLSTGAIIGIIIAAFAILVITIFVVYGALKRRWKKALSKPRSPMAAARNTSGDDHRRRSRLEPWSKLDEGQDSWEGQMVEKKPAADDGDDNRLSLFRKASSTRSGIEEKSTPPVFDPSTMPNFAKYHPDLAAELATAPPMRPFVGRAEANAVSWDGETVGGDSFLSLRISDTSAMSPGTAIKQTPTAVASALHKWQSAEVLTMEEQDTEANVESPPAANPFADEVIIQNRERKGSAGNPFFSAHPSASNPFADPSSRPRKASAPEQPLPTIKRSGSPDSIETVRAGPTRPDSGTRPDSSTQAMQNLLAILDASDDDGRSQRASLQPSVVSSQYPDTERNSMASFVTYTPKAM